MPRNVQVSTFAASNGNKVVSYSIAITKGTVIEFRGEGDQEYLGHGIVASQILEMIRELREHYELARSNGSVALRNYLSNPHPINED